MGLYIKMTENLQYKNEELAGITKQILEFTESNSNTHSAWLTFIYPRLYVIIKRGGFYFRFY